MTDDVLDRLMQEIHRRTQELPAGSYTTKLIRGGVPAMGAKVTEEATEVVEAAAKLAELKATGTAAANNAELEAARQHLVYEAGDVIYHLWVLLGSFGIDTQDIRAELERREGTSGLEEKRRRKESN